MNTLRQRLRDAYNAQRKWPRTFGPFATKAEAEAA